MPDVSTIPSKNLPIANFVDMVDRSAATSRLRVGLADLYVVKSEQGDATLVLACGDSFRAVSLADLT